MTNVITKPGQSPLDHLQRVGSGVKARAAGTGQTTAPSGPPVENANSLLGSCLTLADVAHFLAAVPKETLVCLNGNKTAIKVEVGMAAHDLVTQAGCRLGEMVINIS